MIKLILMAELRNIFTLFIIYFLHNKNKQDSNLHLFY